MYYDSEKDNDNFKKDQVIEPNTHLPDQAVYKPLQEFNPGQFEEGSAEWQMSMLYYLLDMKKRGHKVQEIFINEVK